MVETWNHQVTDIAAQVVLESAREMFGAQPRPNGASRHEIQQLMDVSALLDELVVMYGPSGAHGLAQRFGKVVFRHGLRQLGGQAGFRSTEYRMLPSPKRVQVGLAAMAELLAETMDVRIGVSEDAGHWYWRVERCRECQSRLVAEPGCYALVGLIQEFAAWASGGHFYRVVESECRVKGAEACTFIIDKTPLD